VLEGLSNVTNNVTAVAVSALIFGGVHAVGGVGQVTVAFVSGLLYGWLYLRTRSIVPSSVAHIIYDSAVFYPLILYAMHTKHS
jgi:membrane protease YdiL (CAAX protease family)